MRRAGCVTRAVVVLTVGLALDERADAQIYAGAQYDSGTFARSLAAADLDGDGDVDIATAGVSAQGIGWCRNTGHGAFLESKLLAQGWQPLAVAAGDLDVDGDVDLVAIRESPATLVALLADGSGGFSVSPQSSTSHYLIDVALADLDADGALDAIAAAQTGSVNGFIGVWRGDGQGGFGSPTISSGMQTKIAGTVVVFDATGDGNLDVACSSSSSHVSIFAGNGTSQLATPVLWNIGISIAAVASGDVDGDGRADLLATDRWNGTLRVLLAGAASAGGGLGSPVAFPVGSGPFEIASGDWNEDGALDVAVANEGSHDLSVLLGNGVGGLLPEVRLPSGVNSAALEAAELDGDGHLDLVVGNSGLYLMTPLLGDGKGGFDVATRFPAGPMAWGVDLGDLDQDGHLDAVTTNETLDRFLRSTGNGDGGFQAPASFSCGNSPMGVTIADVNGDGRADVVTANRNDSLITGYVSVRFGNGAGGFSSAIQTATGSGPRAVEVADLSGDGRSDLVTANFNGSSSTVLIQKPNGGYTRVDHPVGFSPRAVAIGDLTGDGVLDFAATHNGPPSVAVFHGMGSGGGAFPAPSHHLVQEYPTDVEFADLDGDGALDVLVSNDNKHSIAVLLGDGVGGLAPASFHTTGAMYPESFELADVDADGWLDAFAVGGVSESALLLGDGEGHLGSPLPFAASAGAVAVTLGDLDEDGHVDAVATSLDTSSILVLLNRSTSGVGCAGSGGSVPTLAADGYVQAGTTSSLVLKSALPGSVALFVFGFEKASLAVTPSCSLLVAPPFAATALVPVVGHGAGTGSATLDVVVREGAVAPLTVYAQAFVGDPQAPAGFAATNAVQVTTQ